MARQISRTGRSSTAPSPELGGRTALRSKCRGQWRSWTWRDLVDVVGRPGEDAPASSSPEVGADDAVLLLSFDGENALPDRLAQAWRRLGFILVLAEEHGDELTDLREARPQVVAASAAVFERWYDDTLARQARQKGPSGRWARTFLSSNSRSSGVLVRWVRGRLRAALGLTGTRVLWCTEGVPSAQASLFFRQLGLAVWPAGPAEPARATSARTIAAKETEGDLVSRPLPAS